MGPKLRLSTADKLSDLEDRLQVISARSRNADRVPGENLTQLSLRDLLDEAGFYDRTGGIDRAITQAESAGDKITALPPLTMASEVTTTGELEPLAYRRFFPQIDYSRAETPIDVFMPSVESSEPLAGGLLKDTSFYSPRFTPSAPRARDYTSLINNVDPRDVSIGMGLLDEYGTASPDNIRPLKEDYVRSNDYLERLSTDPRVAKQVELGAEAYSRANQSNPEHIVLGVKPGQRPTHGDSFSAILLHEMSHAGLQSPEKAAYNANILPPNMEDRLLDQYYQYYELGTIPPEEILQQIYSAEGYPPDLAAMLSARTPLAKEMAEDLSYRTKPVESDAALADIKRVYAAETGRLVDNTDEARKALRFFRDYGGGDILSPLGLPYDVQPNRLTADYFLNPSKYTQGGLTSEEYTTRMTELFGLGGAAVLSGLLGDEEDENARVRY